MTARSSLSDVKTVKNVAVSIERAKKIMKEFRPDAVIGTGGYVCYPVLTAAAHLHIPTLVHESNAVPGLTTKLLARHVDRIMVGFEDSRSAYPDPDKVYATGTPVRGSFSCYTQETAKKELGIPNDTVMSDLIPLMKEQADFRLIHAAGSRYYDEVCEKLAVSAPDRMAFGADVRKYIYDMPRVMAAADLILCRAGASSLAELTYMGKPAIIVPSPNVTNHHQEKNARVLEKAGGARVLLEGEFEAGSLLALIRDLLADEEQMKSMRSAMRSLAVPDATDRICEVIVEAIRH